MTPITNIINYSLKEGSFPNCFKITYITTLLKKPRLDRNLKNYRPVSNLSFISKLTGIVTSVKRGFAISTNQPTKDCILQKQYSLKFKNNIAASMDSSKEVALRCIGKFLSVETAALLVNSMISS